MNVSAAPHATPIPFPTKPQPAGPATWATTPLAESTYTSTKPKWFGGTKETSFTDTGFAMASMRHSEWHSVGSHKKLNQETAGLIRHRDKVAFAPAGTNSFEDALNAAHGEAIFNTNHAGKPSASIGVLQAANGAYYMTNLGSFSGMSTFERMSIEPAEATNVTLDVKALSPDLKAIVSPTSWVNFTDQKIDFTPTVAH